MSRRRVKGRKIRRGSTLFGRSARRKAIKNTLLTILVLMIIPVGYFTGKFMMEDVRRPADNSPDPTSTVTTTSASATTKPTADPSTPANVSGSLRAVYLTTAQLKDTAGLASLLDNAAGAGFNAVLFDLKDEAGVLHYASATAFAQQSKAAAADALSTDTLKALIQTMAGKGFAAIPRLYAFRDTTAPFTLPSAKITVQDYHSYTWLDKSKEKGGKPWLNPYSPDAHRYIIEMAKELADTGFTAVMLDGVQFPNQTSQAYYGNSDLTSLSNQEVLKKFLADCQSAVGDNCVVMQTLPGLSAFGDGTEPFGGNPVTYGAKRVAPVLLPSSLGSKIKTGETTLADPAGHPYDAVRLASGQVKLRLELMESSKRPSVMPWIQAYDYSAEQIRQQMQAVTETWGGSASYIVYHPQGSYDFAALKG